MSVKRTFSPFYTTFLVGHTTFMIHLEEIPPGQPQRPAPAAHPPQLLETLCLLHRVPQRVEQHRVRMAAALAAMNAPSCRALSALDGPLVELLRDAPLPTADRERLRLVYDGAGTTPGRSTPIRRVQSARCVCLRPTIWTTPTSGPTAGRSMPALPPAPVPTMCCSCATDGSPTPPLPTLRFGTATTGAPRPSLCSAAPTAPTFWSAASSWSATSRRPTWRAACASASSTRCWLGAKSICPSRPCCSKPAFSAHRRRSATWARLLSCFSLAMREPPKRQSRAYPQWDRSSICVGWSDVHLLRF